MTCTIFKLLSLIFQELKRPRDPEHTRLGHSPGSVRQSQSAY